MLLKKRKIRETLEKYKQVIVFGLKEEKIVSRIQREEKEKNLLNKLLKKVMGEDSQVVQQVEEFQRIGKCEEEKMRSIRIRFATQVQAEVINGAWRSSGDEEYRNVWINRELDEMERLKQKELINEAKEKNKQTKKQ